MNQFDPMRIRLMICVAVTTVVALAAARMHTDNGPGDVRYEPSPPAAVARMLEMGKASRAGMMYDLDSGDGRFVMAAARDFGVARAIGVEIDSGLVARSWANAEDAGLRGRQLRFGAIPEDGGEVGEVTFQGRPENETLRGTLRGGDERIQLRARREPSTGTAR